MAVNSMQQILGYVSDGKLRRLIEEYEEKHQKLEYESFRKLTELNEAGKEPEKMASAFSWLSTEMKMMMKGDDNCPDLRVSESVRRRLDGQYGARRRPGADGGKLPG